MCITILICLPFVRFNSPWDDACLISGCGLLFTGMTIPGRLTTSNPAEKSVDTNCPESCTDLPDGPYASCKGCERFMYCHKGEMFDVYTCPDGEFWDDIAKDCLNTTSTCHPLRNCVQTCEGIDNGNYQSCQSCNVYATGSLSMAGRVGQDSYGTMRRNCVHMNLQLVDNGLLTDTICTCEVILQLTFNCYQF